MAKDTIHQIIKQALINDGWIITDDPLTVNLYKSERYYEIDLGAEKMITATKGVEKIAVEVKSLMRRSLLHEFHGVLGQYLAYMEALEQAQITDRALFLGISEASYNKITKVHFLESLIKKYKLSLLIVNVNQEKIVQWIK